jgi:hypothetical protein
MTDEILKHLNKAKACGEFTVPPNVCAPYLEALRVAVGCLDSFDCDEQTYGECSRCDILPQIAKILGVKGNE